MRFIEHAEVMHLSGQVVFCPIDAPFQIVECCGIKIWITEETLKLITAFGEACDFTGLKI
jgi:hypothetical protein